MIYSFKFEVNELPKPTNAQNSMHWREKGKYVIHWHGIIAACVGIQRPRTALVKAKLTLTRFSSTEPDYDGLVSSFKPVIDGLIACGVLINDKVSNIGQSNYQWLKTQRGQGKITVEIQEITNG